MNIADTIATVWGNVWPYLVAILLFGVIIAIHEFGHFFFAKLFKVKVNEFALGMGPAILKKKIGETLYALRLFPIGGFVSMEGEDSESDDEGAFNKKKPYQRFIIVAAGAILNLILGVIVVSVCLSMQDLVGTREVHSFHENAISCEYGLKSGDEIIKINNTHIYSSRGISFNMVRDTDNKLDITVIREGKQVELKDVEFRQFEYEGRQYLEQDFYIVGVAPEYINILGKKVVSPSWVWTIVKNAALDSASIVQMVRLSLVDLCTGKYGMKDVSGPIGTISAIADSTAQGPTAKDKLFTALTLLSYITINVGVFNLLPVPALDGGRLFFIFIEMIRRKPINPKKEGVIHTVGLVLLLLFMAIVSISDIIKVF
ncbi:MAG: site-2 protease family protein [Clostridia bacterium]|nr:site-2 protease family protein [Clostridia bacterium]